MEIEGILVVENAGQYQIVAAVSTLGEAIFMAQNYIQCASNSQRFLTDKTFVVRMRGAGGFYNSAYYLGKAELQVSK